MVQTRTRSHLHLPVVLCATMVAVALLAASCSKDATTGASGSQTEDTSAKGLSNPLEANDPPKTGGKLIMALTAETNGWNPSIGQWADAGNFAGSTMLEPLLAYDAQGGFIPWLATSVEPQTPGVFDSWIIKVRPDVTFHNGEKLDATIVKRNIDNYASPGALSALALNGVYKDIKVIDPLTLQVDLNVPWSSYRTNLSGGSGYIMANAMLDAPDQGKAHPVGTGPFVFESWVPDNNLRVKKNPTYWRKSEDGRQQPYLDEIEFRPIPDDTARAQALQSGDIDMELTTNAEDAARFKGDFTVITDFNAEKAFVMLNTAGDPSKGTNPFTNIHARKALAYATNREALAQTMSSDIPLKSSTTPIIAGTKWEMDESKTGYVTYDPAKAKQEIELYKQESGQPNISFQLAGVATIENQKAMQTLQAQWKEVGIESTIDTREQTSYITQIVLGGYQASFFRNYSYLHPDSDRVFMHSSQAKGLGVLSVNFQQLKDPELDAVLDDARSTDDLAKQKEDYAKATQLLNAQAVNIWLYNTPYSLIAWPRVRGLNPARQQSFGNILPKPWFWVGLWKS